MGIGGNEHAVEMELKELLFVGADRSGDSCGDDRGPQVCGRLDGTGSASNKELVIDVRRRKGVQGEARIASQIRSFR
jgi:hypothetical protein